MDALVGIGTFFVLLTFQAGGIVGGDSGDLVTAAATFGNPHPPGYPLYTFLSYVLTKLVPYGSPVWKVGLMSSLPSAITVWLIFRWVRSLTGSSVAALVSVLSLIGSYVFFFYSVTPEVFALYTLFTMLLFVLIHAYRQKRSRVPWWTIPVVGGLALAHHQLIIFSFPAYAYLLFAPSGKRRLQLPVRRILTGTGIMGCSYVVPYIYSFIAGHGSSIVNWNRPVTLVNLLKLMTRADYGTFQSSQAFAENLPERLVNVKLYTQFLWGDMSIAGLVLAAVGIAWLWRRQRRLAIAFLIHLALVGPAFFFYASFPLVNRFMLGTFERFMMPTYAVVSVLIGAGLYGLGDIAAPFLRRFIESTVLRKWLFTGVSVLIVLYMGVRAGKVVSVHAGLPADTTGDRFARDILSAVPRGKPALVLLTGDTSFFMTEYVRYALNERPEIALFHIGLLGSTDQQRIFAAHFPGLTVPDKRDESLLSDIVTQNYGKYLIFTNQTFYIPGNYFFIPTGLMYEVVDEAHLKQPNQFLSVSDTLFAGFQHPDDGILGRFNHMMLSDIRNVYANAALKIADISLKAGDAGDAVRYADMAAGYQGDTVTEDAYFLKSQALTAEKDCHGALKAVQKAEDLAYIPNPKYDFQRGIIYRDCLGDARTAQPYLDRYDAAKDEYAEPLPKVAE